MGPRPGPRWLEPNGYRRTTAQLTLTPTPTHLPALRQPLGCRRLQHHQHELGKRDWLWGLGAAKARGERGSERLEEKWGHGHEGKREEGWGRGEGQKGLGEKCSIENGRGECCNGSVQEAVRNLPRAACVLGLRQCSQIRGAPFEVMHKKPKITTNSFMVKDVATHTHTEIRRCARLRGDHAHRAVLAAASELAHSGVQRGGRGGIGWAEGVDGTRCGTRRLARCCMFRRHATRA